MIIPRGAGHDGFSEDSFGICIGIFCLLNLLADFYYNCACIDSLFGEWGESDLVLVTVSSFSRPHKG